MSSTGDVRVSLARGVHATISPARAITVHAEGQRFSAQTLALMGALGAVTAPWHEAVKILLAWAEHAPVLRAQDAAVFATSTDYQRRTKVATLSVDDPLLPLAARDPDSDVRANAAKAATARAGAEDLVRLLAGDPHWWVRCCVAAGAVVPVDVVDQLAATPDIPVQTHLAASGQPLSDAAVRSLQVATPEVGRALRYRGAVRARS